MLVACAYHCQLFPLAVFRTFRTFQMFRQSSFPYTPMQKLKPLYSQAGSSHNYADNSCILGLCTGALAAVAVGCSRSTLELIPMAVEAITTAFRVGMRVADVAQRLDTSEASERSWSMIVPGLASAEAVHAFCEQTVRVSLSSCFLSTSSLSGLFTS